MSVILPKHREVERVLRQEILDGIWGPGDRISSEQELSRRFGVAYMTARQAVGTLVGDGLLQRIPGKGTFVLPRTAVVPVVSTSPIVLVVPELWQRLDPYYFPDVLGGFENEIHRCGCRATISDYATADREDLVPSDRVVACLLLEKEEARLAERLLDRGCRVVAVNRYMGRRAIPSIAPDNVGGGISAVDHLVSLGHTRIGIVRGLPDNLDAIERRRGFREALRRHDLPLDKEAGNGFREEFGYRAAMQLLSGADRPTALVTASDLSAAGAIRAAQEAGLSVPEDLSIVGFGDFEIAAYVQQGLTTVYLPRLELGQATAQALISLASGNTVTSRLVPTRFVKRATTAPPPTKVKRAN